MIKADHVMLRTPNLEDSIMFYEFVLGMSVNARDNRMDNVENKYDSAFMICKETGFQVELVYNKDKDSKEECGEMFGHLAFRTDEFDEVYKRAKAFGSVVVEPISHLAGESSYKIGSITSVEGAPIGLVQKTSTVSNKFLNKFLITGCSDEENLGAMIAREIKIKNPSAEIIAINSNEKESSILVKQGIVDYEFFADLSDILSVVSVCREILSEIPFDIDCFIHAAGVSNLSTFSNIEYKDLAETINVNALSPVAIMKELETKLIGSTCMFICSNASHIPMRCSLAYNVSKAALKMAMQQTARELTRPNDMTIFSISPNKLRDTGMSKITDEIVPRLRGWTKQEAKENQDNALLNGEQTDPGEFSRFVADLLLEKSKHKMMSGCDIPYGV